MATFLACTRGRLLKPSLVRLFIYFVHYLHCIVFFKMLIFVLLYVFVLYNNIMELFCARNNVNKQLKQTKNILK